MNLGAKKVETKKESDRGSASHEKESTNSSSKNFFQQTEDVQEKEESAPRKTKSQKSTLFVIAGISVAAIIVIIILFSLLFNTGNKNKPQVQQPPSSEVQSNQGVQDVPATPSTQAAQGNVNTPKTQNGGQKDVGFQDFTGDTNMKTSTNLDDPNSILKDVYGLSVRVDYEVSDIDYVTDFVNYKKHRGTWGGGLELYWLEATYKDIPYIIQIPFKYYKELDDVGIVPVKMEVLRINVIGSTSGNERTIVSYMTLDEATLKTLLKNRK